MSKPTEHQPKVLTRNAESDLSSYQYRAVKPGTNDDQVDVVVAADADAIGILRNAPASGGPAEFGYFGVMLAEVGGAVGYGDHLATDINGRLVTATDANVDTTTSSASQDVAGSPVVAKAFASAGASGEIIPVFFFGSGALV